MADAEPDSPEFAVFWCARMWTILLVTSAKSDYAPVFCKTEPEFQLRVFSDHAGIDFPSRDFTPEQIAATAERFNALIEYGMQSGRLPAGCAKISTDNPISHRAGAGEKYDAEGCYNPCTITAKPSEEIKRAYAEAFATAIGRHLVEGFEISTNFAMGKTPFGDDCTLFRLNIKGDITHENEFDLVLSLINIFKEVGHIEARSDLPPLVSWNQVKLQPKLTLENTPKADSAKEILWEPK